MKKAKNLLNVFQKTIIAGVVMSFSGVVSAAAFHLSETSISGLGRAFAGEAATAEDAAVVATNPALMTQLSRAQITAGGVLFAPNVDVDGRILNGNIHVSDENIAPPQFVPQIYGVMPITDNFSIGGGINLNYGMVTNYSHDFLAGYLGGRSRLAAINTNLSVAYQYGNWSFGVGADLIYTQAEIKRHMGYLANFAKKAVANPSGFVDHLKNSGKITPAQANGIKAMLHSPAIQNELNTVRQNVNELKPSSTLVKLKGDNISVGANAGIAYNFSANHRIGLAYHSPIFIDFKGVFNNDLKALTNNPALNNALSGLLGKKGIIVTNGKELEGKMKLVLPEFVELAGYNKITDNFALTYGAKWTKWSRFKSLHAINIADGSTLFNKAENFKDSWRYAVGAIYDLNDKWTLRLGLAYETSAINDRATIAIPDTDRMWYTLGATYHPTDNLSLDFGYAYIVGKKTHFVEEKGDPIQATEFDARARVSLYGVGASYKF